MTYIVEPICTARMYWADSTNELFVIQRLAGIDGWVVEQLVHMIDDLWDWRAVRIAPTMREAMAPIRHLNLNIIFEEA